MEKSLRKASDMVAGSDVFGVYDTGYLCVCIWTMMYNFLCMGIEMKDVEG